DLADLLLVGALDDDLRRRRNLEGDARGGFLYHRMRIADVELDGGAADRGAIADALDLEPLFEALGDPIDHVGDQRAREPVQRAVFSALGRTRDRDGPVVLLDLHPPRYDLGELTQRTVDHHASRQDGDGDSGGDFDRLSSNSAQAWFL